MSQTRISFLLLLGLIAHASVLATHLLSMWDSTSFRFFPLAFALAAFVAYRRSDMLNGSASVTLRNSFSSDSEIIASNVDSTFKSRTPNQTIVILGIAFSIFSAIATAILAAPTLGWISFIFFLSLLVYVIYGLQGLKAMWPSWIILLLVRFVPTDLEQRVVLNLQQIVSPLASTLLDIIGFVHTREGIYLGLVGNPLFRADEACNGIRSFFSSLVFVVAWGGLRGYGWGRNLFNLIQAFFWVIVFNALRIDSVLLFQAKTSLSIAEGLSHEVASIFTFVMIVLFILSTDQLIYAFTHKEEFVELDLAVNPKVDGLTNGNLDGSALSPIQSSVESGWGRNLTIVWMIGLGIAGLISLRMLSIADYSVPMQSLRSTPEKESAGELVSGWTLINFAHSKHFDRHPVGKNTFRWTFRKGMREANLELCESSILGSDPELYFNSTGWTCGKLIDDIVDQQTALTTESQPAKEPNNSNVPLESLSDGRKYQRFDIQKTNGESGIVLFAMLGSTGKNLDFDLSDQGYSVPFWSKRFSRGTDMLVGRSESLDPKQDNLKSSNISLKLTCVPSVELQSTDLKELELLFLGVQTNLRNSAVFSTEN